MVYLLYASFNKSRLIVIMLTLNKAVLLIDTYMSKDDTISIINNYNLIDKIRISYFFIYYYISKMSNTT